MRTVMDISREVLRLLDEVLSLNGRTSSMTADSPLLGGLPEFDSMAVVALVNGIEERFGVAVDDDEIESATFATLGSLCQFVTTKLA